MAMPQPELGEKPDEMHGRDCVTVVEQPTQRRPQVGLLGPDRGPTAPLRQSTATLDTLDIPHAPVSMMPPDVLQLATLTELLERELADRLQHHIARESRV